MAVSDIILPEFDQEMANTRKVLERVPEEHFDWQPHEKSYTLRELTTHVINVPTWVGLTLEEGEFDIAPAGAEPFHVAPISSVSDGLSLFETNVATARKSIEAASDEQLMLPWTLLAGGEEVFTMPRLAVFRTMIMNHLIHHRAQLGIYLRLKDVSLPNLYGPTADEN